MSRPEHSRAQKPLGRVLAVAVAFVMAATTAEVVRPAATAAPARQEQPQTPPARDEAADIPSARATATLHRSASRR